MGTQLSFRHAILAAVLGAFGMNGVVLAVNEAEPNHPISSAQLLSISGGVVASFGGAGVTTGGATVSGVIGNLTGSAVLDVDFFSFQGQEGDVVTIDIDGGMGGVRNVDTILTIFGPGPTYRKLRENDDGGTLDTGSTHPFDSRITNFRLPATGTYTVGVSSYPRYLSDGGVYTSTALGTNANGDYTLVISGVTVAVQHINVEIKPGSGEVAPVNPRSRGKIPVALLSSGEFNALDVDVASLTFGATGDERSLSRCGRAGEDVNGDGLPDLVCHFENQLAQFTPGDLEGIVKGTTADGRQFEGRGLLKVVPVKRQY
ncbi:MAG TPA: DVUA0089 family protein [Burkholderiales bacterium]|nr:DVUA0089 family protein [Burkholderiales bacterium]